MPVIRPVTVVVQTPVIQLATRTVIMTTAIQRPVVTLRSIATQTATTHVTVHVTHCLVNVVTNCLDPVVADRPTKHVTQIVIMDNVIRLLVTIAQQDSHVTR